MNIDPRYDDPLAEALDAAGRPGAVCADCPVRDDCLAWALDTRQRYGIWGGTSEIQRRRLRRQRARGNSA